MVVLNVVAPKNDWTADFEEPIPKAHYVKLISGSLFNSWHNSERVGTMLLKILVNVLYLYLRGVTLLRALQES